MKTRILLIAMGVLIFLTGSALAQMMNGGHMGGHMGGNNDGGQNAGRNMGGNHMGGGMGSGMAGAGGMVSGMMGNTIFHGYLDALSPLETPSDARDAIQAFLDSSNSDLQISELWDYETAYVAELSDTEGTKAFDLVADKFTGVVSAEMGFSMMMNASYSRSLYDMPKFGKNLNVTGDEATNKAQYFVTQNANHGLLNYTLVTPPEVYPGYYKFHTQDGIDHGMDIMVNGYNGRTWMNTLLGVPLANVTNVP